MLIRHARIDETVVPGPKWAVGHTMDFANKNFIINAIKIWIFIVTAQSGSRMKHGACNQAAGHCDLWGIWFD